MDASGPAPSDYDVFLSFRGPDTRHGIVDHLYESMTDKGIRVFRDDEEICRGEEIRGELERSIRGSRIYIVVFSKNFASSKWCLQELAMIMGFHGDLAAGKIVLPIFYDVHPVDVKLGTKLYRNSLDEHRGKYGKEVVDRWEEDLVKVGRICGWDYEDHMGEGKFVKLVVQDVLSKLNIRDRGLPQHLVGIDDRVEDVVKMLNCDSPEVRVVMVHGMGGIGKTTLANVIFNRIHSRFNGCSFLANVRESSTAHGIVELQNDLLRDILGDSFSKVRDSSDGVKQIKKRLEGKSVLVIFDDVSERSQLDQLIGNGGFFGLGMRIIVTTRDRSVYKGLTGHRAVCTYEMEEMSKDHALQLFNRHAFGVERSPDDFATLSEHVVRTTGNLPLALEVVGGHLCGENKDVWENTLEKLKQVPYKDVMGTLLISYDGLEDREKQIFLDIACFSNMMMPRRYANYMWEARFLYPNCGVLVLLNKSLVKVLKDDEFGMHDLIRDMGREIVRLQGHDSLGKRSRLLNPVDAMNVVRQKEGTDEVLAMNLGSLSDEEHLTCEEFEAMSNLRFLWLRGGQFIGDFRNFRTKLLWLNWEDCERVPNPSFFKMNRLVVLKISGSGITDESMNDLRMGNLKALEIRGSRMTRMPDLSQSSKLERIILQYCSHLETLHSSVGKLVHLMSLNIQSCNSLRSLPEEFGSAKSLQELSLIFCDSIEELPESIGSLRALRVLRARYTKIRKIPTSIGNLKCLEVLEFAFCPLDEDIPKEIGGLSSLEKLNLNGCDLRQLPGTIHQLSRLHSLFLCGCPKLRELPGLPSSLTKLRVKLCSIQALPDLSSLTNLTELVLYDSREVQDTIKLGVLQELPNSLTKLSVESVFLQPLPDLSSLTNLTELVLSDFGAGLEGMSEGHSQPLQLSWLRKLHRLRILNLQIPVLLSTELGCLSWLQELDLCSVDISLLSELPSSLSCLKLSHFGTAVPWVRYSNLAFLRRLYLSNSTLTENQLGELDKFGNLTSLTIECCINLVRLSDLSCMRKLSFLSLSECTKLVDISGIEEMEMLEELTIAHCDSLIRIPDLSDLTRLRLMMISYCRSLRQVSCVIDKCDVYVFPDHWYRHVGKNCYVSLKDCLYE